MNVLSVTTFEDIRAVLGVSPDELEDPTLSLDVYALNLEAEMRDLGPAFVSDFEAVQVKAPVDRTDAERWFLGMSKLFGTYAVAKHLLGSLPLFSPKEITDGKASISRYAANPYTDTIKAVEAQYAQARSRATSAYDAVRVATSTARGALPVFMAAGPASYDPVTGA
jgi:hypothetical protein